jgi:polysaccharide pyruvyl transferase WcaK-like protein
VLRIVVIGDVGVIDGMVHVGDEAMFDEMVYQLRLRGVDHITGISSNPAETRERYGIDAVAGVGFRTQKSRAEQQDRMRAVVRTAEGETGLLGADDPALAVIDAIRASDGVAVSGGGNMASTWPSHIFERATIGQIAALFGKPLVISGQTIGPHLDADDRDLVATLLSSAALVGLREKPSHALSLELGVPAGLLTQTVDDASFLSEQSRPADAAPDTATPYALVSLSTHVGVEDRARFQQAVADLLDHVVESTGLAIRFYAHFASLDATESRGDTVMHDAVIARMASTGAVTVNEGDSVAAARLARGAALVISSRYHPAVFAVSGGVPTIGIPVDDYTTTKLTGALGNFGQNALVSAEQLVAGVAPAVASAVWNDRDAIRERGIAIAETNRAASAEWFNRVAAALGA